MKPRHLIVATVAVAFRCDPSLPERPLPVPLANTNRNMHITAATAIKALVCLRK